MVHEQSYGFDLAALRVTSGALPKMAAQRLLRLLYPDPNTESPKKKDEANRDARNEDIRCRYEAGERVVDLAQEYGMTIQAIYRILRADSGRSHLWRPPSYITVRY